MSSQDVYSLYCKMSWWRKMELTDFLSSSHNSLATLCLRSVRDVKCFPVPPRNLWHCAFHAGIKLPLTRLCAQKISLMTATHCMRQKKEESVACLSSAQGSAIRRGTTAKGAYRLQGSETATIWSRAKTHVHICDIWSSRGVSVRCCKAMPAKSTFEVPNLL